MRILITFLHVLISGFLLSLLGPYLLANALPVHYQKRGLGETIKKFTLHKGSLASVACREIFPSEGVTILINTVTKARVGKIYPLAIPNKDRCVMLVTQIRSDRKKGIIFSTIRSEEDLGEEFFRKNTTFTPLVDGLEKIMKPKDYHLFGSYCDVKDGDFLGSIGPLTIEDDVSDVALFIDAFEAERKKPK